MHFGVFHGQPGRHFLEVALERHLNAAPELPVRFLHPAGNLRGVRLPAERRICFAHTNRRLQLAGHRRRVALNQVDEVRQPADTVEVELPVGSLLKNGPGLVEPAERQQRCREVRVRGNELWIETNGFAKRLHRLLKPAEANECAPNPAIKPIYTDEILFGYATPSNFIEDVPSRLNGTAPNSGPFVATNLPCLAFAACQSANARRTYRAVTVDVRRLPANRWMSDISYVWTREGWLYLAVVIDLFSRKIVGWSMSSRMKASIVCDALTMAFWQRKPEPGLIVHSDRGSQYASHEYRKLLSDWGCVGSMSRKGNCWDNAVAESFFGSLKQERVQWRHYQTRFEAQQDVLNYITVKYNNFRLHSTLGYKNPNQFEFEYKERGLKKVA